MGWRWVVIWLGRRCIVEWSSRGNCLHLRRWIGQSRPWASKQHRGSMYRSLFRLVFLSIGNWIGKTRLLRMSYWQFGLDLDGDATTTPADAPGTAEPLAPMLFRIPWRAIDDSDCMNPSSPDCRRWGWMEVETAAGTSRAKVKISEKNIFNSSISLRLVYLFQSRLISEFISQFISSTPEFPVNILSNKKGISSSSPPQPHERWKFRTLSKDHVLNLSF